MATYEEIVYANDCFLYDPITAQTTRAAQLTLNTQYAYTIYDIPPTFIHAHDFNTLRLRFPGRGEEYRKKNLVSIKEYLYVVTKNGATTGTLPSGSYVMYGLSSLYERLDYLDQWIYTRFEQITNGAYLDVTQLTGSKHDPRAICANAAVEGVFYQNTSYTHDISVVVQSHLGTNKPYSVLTFEDVIPYVQNPYPQGGFVNEQKDAVFGWTFNYPKYSGIEEEIRQQSAKFRWRTAGTEEYTEILVEGEQNTVTIPAGTFSTESIEWQVVVTSDDGIEGTPSAWYTLTTVDSLSEAIPEYPVSTFCDGSEPITMTWKHVIPTGSDPSGFDIQYSGDGGLSWIDLAGGIQSENTEYTVPADTFPAGRVTWRVRTYNSDGVVGEWSEPAAFINQAAPPAPVASIEILSPRPTIRWQSVGQQAYQIQAEDYDGGQLYGSEKRFKIPVFLPDGPVDIRVRVQNSFGLWSDWGVVSATIQNAALPAPHLIARPTTDAAVLTWNDVQADAYYVYRDGVPIALTDGLEWTDDLAVGAHSYTVRAAAEDGNYAMSNEVQHRTEVRHAMIGMLPEPDWMLLKYRRGNRPTHGAAKQATVAYHNYAGRMLPVADVSPFRTITDNFAFTVMDEAEREKLWTMVGSVVMLKTETERIVGMLERCSGEIRGRSDVEFTIHRLEWSDEIEYTV